MTVGNRGRDWSCESLSNGYSEYFPKMQKCKGIWPLRQFYCFSPSAVGGLLSSNLQLTLARLAEPGIYERMRELSSHSVWEQDATTKTSTASPLRGFSSRGPEQSWHLLLSPSPQAPGSWVWLEKMILRLALAAREAGKPVSTLSLERRDSQGKLPQNIRKVGGPGARQSPSRVTDNRQWDPQGVLIFSGPYHSAAQKRQKHQLWIYLKLQLPEYVLELDHFSCKS